MKKVSDNNKSIQIFDTTLRDGTQGEKIAFSAGDKLRIAKRLDSFGVDYIEGGWPGSNPKDMEFFDLARANRFSHSKLVAFGSTCRAGNAPAEDANLQALLASETPAVSIFGKSWLLHVLKALNISPEHNLEIIFESIQFIKEHSREVIYDAEHFFDGFKDNPTYALKTLNAAATAGADTIVLCDTNGGTLPHEMGNIIAEVRKSIDKPVGIHTHNDCELATANVLTAVQAGCGHVQGTINGYGERCGNANLCSVIPALQLKMGYHCVDNDSLPELTALSHFVSELANVAHNNRLPFVGRSAFAHKGGIHVSAVMKHAKTYEHIEPEKVGNSQRVLVSELSGRSNVCYKAEEFGFDLDKNHPAVNVIVNQVKELENDGYEFEAAEASFELLVEKATQPWDDFFKLEGFRVIIEKDSGGETRSEATIRLNVNGQTEHCAAEGIGPVHALDSALRKALAAFYPAINKVQLIDYKVRVLNESDGTAAKVRVLIDSSDDHISWSTIGVSEDIIEASWQALIDSMSYYLKKTESVPQKSLQTI